MVSRVLQYILHITNLLMVSALVKLRCQIKPSRHYYICTSFSIYICYHIYDFSWKWEPFWNLTNCLNSTFCALFLFQFLLSLLGLFVLGDLARMSPWGCALHNYYASWVIRSQMDSFKYISSHLSLQSIFHMGCSFKNFVFVVESVKILCSNSC